MRQVIEEASTLIEYQDMHEQMKVAMNNKIDSLEKEITELKKIESDYQKLSKELRSNSRKLYNWKIIAKTYQKLLKEEEGNFEKEVLC